MNEYEIGPFGAANWEAFVDLAAKHHGVGVAAGAPGRVQTVRALNHSLEGTCRDDDAPCDRVPSLDGVMPAPGDPEADTEGGLRHGGWQRQYFDDVLGAAAAEGMAATGTYLFGRKTNEKTAVYWRRRPWSTSSWASARLCWAAASGCSPDDG